VRSFPLCEALAFCGASAVEGACQITSSECGETSQHYSIRIEQATDFHCASPQVAVISGSSYTNQRLAEITNWNDWTNYKDSGYTPGRFAVNKLFNNEAYLSWFPRVMTRIR